MNTYIPESDRIVHNTFIDFKKRSVNSPIHIVQYDNCLPILAVDLRLDGNPYTIPNNAEANIRLKKRDGKVVYNPVLGTNTERNILYVEITYQMTTVNGRVSPVLEILLGDKVAASSSIEIEIDRNPIQEGDIESTDEMKTIVKFVGEAKEAAEEAKTYETNASASETKAKTSETNASAYASAAKASETNAKSSETKAATSATNAAGSANLAAQAANASSQYAVASSESAMSASESKERAVVAETNTKNSEQKVEEYVHIIEETPVGEVIDALGMQKATLILSDSEGNPIQDSSSNSIEATSVFVDAQTITYLVDKTNSLEYLMLEIFRVFNFDNAAEAMAKMSEFGSYIAQIEQNTSDISKLQTHAILDSDYQ